jgi:hypothetical protein
VRGFYHAGVSWNSSAFIKQKKRKKNVWLKTFSPLSTIIFLPIFLSKNVEFGSATHIHSAKNSNAI